MKTKFLALSFFALFLILPTFYFQTPVKASPNAAPASFDWRNVHGKNWVSPVRNLPNVHGCFSDANTALLETQINLYYNRQYNLDLSEQAGRDCYYDGSGAAIPELIDSYIPDPNCPAEGSTSALFARRTVNAGIFDEACDTARPTVMPDFVSCTNDYICSDWQSRVWKAAEYKELYTARVTYYDVGSLGYDDMYGSVTQLQCPITLANTQYLENEVDFKKALISNGPMHTYINPWGHEMLLTGYNTAEDWENLDYCEQNLNRRTGYCYADGCDRFEADCNANLVGDITCYQNDLWECTDAGGGSYPLQKIASGCKEPSCASAELGNTKCLNDGIYTCTDDPVHPYWVRTSNCDGVCANEQCVSSSSSFNPGDTRCLRNGGNDHFVYQEYTPGSKLTYWTFKNQNLGGVDFGDDGFINATVPYDWLVSGIYFKGPYTSPSNTNYLPQDFDGSINCEDLDGDSYCNWGISANKPANCSASCQAVKDCDDSNPGLLYYDQNMKCISDSSDVAMSAAAVKVAGSTYDLNITVTNNGTSTASNLSLNFMKSYDELVSATGFSCSVNRLAFEVNCSLNPLSAGSSMQGTIRMISLQPTSVYVLTVGDPLQGDPTLADNSATITLTSPVQTCESIVGNQPYQQDCMNTDDAGTYYTTRGDPIGLVCTDPGSPLATGCTPTNQIRNLQNGISVVDKETGKGMVMGQAGSSNPATSVLLRSANNTLIAETIVDMTSSPDWSNVTAGADNSTFKTFVHNLTSASGAAASYSLYVPKGNGQSVRVCPGAASLDAVTLVCSGGYNLSPGIPQNGATAEVVSINGIEYWKVSGLTGTGALSIGASFDMYDNMNWQKIGTASDHTIVLGTINGLLNSGNTLSIQFDPESQAFSFPVGLSITDITLGDEGGNKTLAALPGATSWGVEINSSTDTITFTAPWSGGYIPAGNNIVIGIGLAVGGSHQLINPVATGSYRLAFTISNGSTEAGDVAVPIVDSDQVTVSSFVNTFISFDIDTAVADSSCDFNSCLTHEHGTQGINYTVDLGELNSTWVNRSNGTAVNHVEGGSGVINSIYLDLTTNAFGGVIVYVNSLNGGLQGPDANLIASVSSDGDAITINSGLYGFQLPVAGTGNGVITRAGCIAGSSYCALSTVRNEVFNTNSAPLDAGRLRMDLGAAAQYTNNPGNYTDTLTFTAVGTF